MLTAQFVFSKAIIGQVAIASAICAALVLALEPADTSGLPLLAEYGLWLTHFLTFAAIYLGCFWGLQRIGFPAPWPVILSAIVLLPLTAAASLILDYGFGATDEELNSPLPFLFAFASEMIAVAPLALTVAAAIVLFLRRDTPQSPRISPEEDALVLSELLSSAPRNLGSDIIRLHARDHYVELITTQGSALLTEQFGDCVERLHGFNGVQCHRSHWISLDHVTAVNPTGSTYACILSNGDEVPVSRRRYSELRDVVRTAAKPKAVPTTTDA